jgi:hypothetical protein
MQHARSGACLEISSLEFEGQAAARNLALLQSRRDFLAQEIEDTRERIGIGNVIFSLPLWLAAAHNAGAAAVLVLMVVINFKAGGLGRV